MPLNISKKLLFISASVIVLVLFLFKKDSREVVVHGELLAGDFFAMQVRYTAKNEIGFCQDWSLFGGTQQETESFKYYPTKTGTHYEFTVPLDEMRWSFICDFQPTEIWTDTQNLFEVTPESITFVKNPYRGLSVRETKFIGQDGNRYEINFAKMIAPVERTDWYKKEKRRKKLKAMYPEREMQKQMMLLQEHVIYPYIQEHKKIPNATVGQQLLQQNTKHLKELRKKISYVDGNFIDMWGNPFQYRVKKAQGNKKESSTLFSLGPDGVKSSDDIEAPQGPLVPLRKIAYYARAEKMEITSDRLWLITKIFKAYIVMHKKSPSQEEGERLLRLEGDFSPYFDKGITENYVKELKETIPYRDGYPLDIWNNPFIYKEEKQGVQASISSTGEDGLDNGEGLRRNLPVRKIIRRSLRAR